MTRNQVIEDASGGGFVTIVGLLNALPQSDKGYSFQIGSANIAKLSDEQKAIATDKGWTLI